MAITALVNELQTPGTHGLNAITRTYTNPGGIPADQAGTEIRANLALVLQKDVQVYRQTIQASEYFTILSSTALIALNTQQRADYQAFILPMLTDEIREPEMLLKNLTDTIFASHSSVTSGYDALIKELVSIRDVLQLGNISLFDMQEAMQALGWVS